MKPHLDIKHQGTLGSEDRTRMTIDENSVAHLMGILTDLYSDRELAVIREYSTNAWDSHRAAGISDPIEVSTPTSLFPSFVVKDHGVGLSVDEVLTQFSKYGFSSKRDSDNEVGMLGLGCKSALTYTSQFTLIVTKNGEQAMILVTREADGAGSVQVIATESTDEPNGVEVQVPVANPLSFIQKIHEFFKYWDRGTVLVDGKEPESVWDAEDAFRLDPDVIILRGNDNDKVVMGGVTYPIPRTDHVHSIMPTRYGYLQSHVVVRVEIGAVNFVPSREALQFTKRTNEAIQTARQFVYERTQKIAQDEINAEPTFADGLRKALEWQKVWPVHHTYTYLGREIPSGFGYEDGPHAANISRWSSGYPVDSQASRTNWINAHEALGAVFVTGYKSTGMHRAVKLKVKEYVKENFAGANKTVFMFPDKKFLGPWAEGLHIVDWETTIKPIDTGEAKGADKKEPAAYRIVTSGDTWKPAVEIKDQGEPVVLLEASAGYQQREYAYSVARANDKSVLLVLKTQIKRFTEELPKAVWVREWLPKVTAEFLSNLTAFECLTIHMHTNDDGERLAEFIVPFQIGKPERVYDHRIGKYKTATDPLDTILDPEVHWLVKMTRDVDRSVTSNYSMYCRAMKEFGHSMPALPIDVKHLEKRLRAVLTRYPLFMLHEPTRRYMRPQATTQQFIQYLNDTYTLYTS